MLQRPSPRTSCATCLQLADNMQLPLVRQRSRSSQLIWYNLRNYLFLLCARTITSFAFEPTRQGLFTMQAKAKQSALSRQQHQGPSSGFSSLHDAAKQTLPVHLHNTMLGFSRTILASEMPAVEPLPPYKAWDYLVSNELAQGVGRQMYYTDEIGIC